METLIGTIEKNKKTRTHVRLTTWKDNTYVDVRDFFLSKSGEYIPTKRGITIRANVLSEILSFMEQAEAQIKGAK